jgi:hypothetical protein
MQKTQGAFWMVVFYSVFGRWERPAGLGLRALGSQNRPSEKGCFVFYQKRSISLETPPVLHIARALAFDGISQMFGA